MESRTGKQCRERYINHLDPDMKKTAWTVAENNVIRDNFPEFGTKWSQYMIALPGRSDNAIKNRYHVISRNNFDSAHTSDVVPIIKVIVAQKRSHSEASSEDSELNSTEGDLAEDQNRKRLKKLLAARIVLELEILELERQCAMDDDGSLSTNTSPGNSESFLDVAGEESPMELGELDSDFDFDFEWTDADTLLATEHANILEVKYRSEAEKLAGKKIGKVPIIVIQV